MTQGTRSLKRLSQDLEGSIGEKFGDFVMKLKKMRTHNHTMKHYLEKKVGLFYMVEKINIHTGEIEWV